MATESFTVEDFKQAIRDYRYDDLGWIAGERVFAVDLGKQVSICIRSSIRNNGYAAASGEDSIRLWLAYQGQSLSAKGVPTGINERYIQRVSGWQERLTTAIEKLRLFRQVLGDCRDCGKPNMALVSHTAKNPGKVFSKCIACGKWGAWLDTDSILNQAVLPLTGASKSVNQTNKQTDEPEVFAPISGKGDLSSPGKAKKQCCCDECANPKCLNVGQEMTVWCDHFISVYEKPTDTVMAAESDDNLMAGLSFLSDASALTVSEEDQPQEPKAFTPSKYQSAIFDFVKGQSENAVVEAVAGSGKTTTLVKALEFTPTDLKVGFVAFNKHIAVELQKRAPEHVHVSTLHSLGYNNIRRALGNQVQLNQFKLQDIFDSMTESLPSSVKFELKQDKPTVCHLVNLCKGTLREPNAENLDYLCDRYGIQVNGNKDDLYDFTGKLWHQSFSNLNTIDYEDMIFASAYGITPCEKFDILFVDESQDLNQAQIEMALKSGTRIVCVGDRRQSIYGFRGADTEAIPNLIRALQAQTLPLSISYRCPKSVVQLAKTIVPQIEYRDNAPDGTIDEITETKFHSDVKNGDLVLCRTNAPLVKPCFDLIRRGVKATIRGRDIGNGLVQLLEKHAKREGISNLKMLLYSLDGYVQNESSKLIAANKGTRAQSLQDQFETLLALSDGCFTVSEVKAKVGKIFSDEQAAVTFSSIHRAKGDESNRVYILHPELLPHPLAKQSWEQVQESNLKYVTITRSKSELYFVY